MLPAESPAPRHPDRREFVALGVGALVLATVPIVSRRQPRLVRRTIPVMGTLAEVVVLDADERAAQVAVDAALAELRRVEALMTRFTATSDIGRANAGAARDGVRVSAESAEVVLDALRWAEATDGRFDPAIGAASELWEVLDRREPPAEAAVRRLAGRGLWRSVDVSRRTDGSYAIRFSDPDVHLDLGGIAKGHAVDRAIAALRERGAHRAMVVAGGDLYAMGAGPGDDDWRVGIRDPHDTRRLAGELLVRDRGVATSGDYERFFRWRGVRYHHLIDPETAAPRRTPFRSQTVVAPTCRDADVAATATFGLSQEPAERSASSLLGAVEVRPLA